MAQHDFVPAWLNFSTPQSAKVNNASWINPRGKPIDYEMHK